MQFNIDKCMNALIQSNEIYIFKVIFMLSNNLT